jgi:hypothetical protein
LKVVFLCLSPALYSNGSQLVILHTSTGCLRTCVGAGEASHIPCWTLPELAAPVPTPPKVLPPPPPSVVPDDIPSVPDIYYGRKGQFIKNIKGDLLVNVT